MKGVGAGLKVGATALLIALLGYLAFKFIGKGIRTDGGYTVWSLFTDATGLVDKSRVQIAGLVVGQIQERRLVYDPETRSTRARVELRVQPDIDIFSNAVLYKRTASLLGEFYLEIDPGTPASVDPKTGQPRPNYRLKGCQEVTQDPDCNRIRSVVEPVGISDVMGQVQETLPVLRDILRDVQTITHGPLQEITREVQSGIRANSEAAEKLISHLDLIAKDLRNITAPSGTIYEDFRQSLDNIRQITESVKSLVGAGEGQMNSTGDKIKRDLDQLSGTLEKLNKALDDVGSITGKVAKGEGTVGKLLADETVGKNIEAITEDVSNFVRSITKLQTIVGIREEYNLLGESFKTYLTLLLVPRPDKFYMIEFVDDPRGSFSYNHEFQSYQGTGNGMNPAQQGTLNTDTWHRGSAFRFSFMFGKRLELGPLGVTGRLGIKESTGGVGLDLDLFKKRLLFNVDLFDTMAADYPRLKVWGAIELFKHAWLVAGIDDILNAHTDGVTVGPGNVAIPCGPATPANWCKGGRDYIFGAMLTFNDEDLRSLFTVGGAALLGTAVAR